MTIREHAVAALFALLTSVASFKTASRRARAPESIPFEDTPALTLLQHAQAYKSPSFSQPAIRSLKFFAMIYADTGDDENAIPSAITNPICDAIDAVLNNRTLGAQTLGGLVTAAFIDGDVVESPGDFTGKNLVLIPITILLP
jgi:hypothetical protein